MLSVPFKHFGALKNNSGFGIAVADLDPVEETQINDGLRELKSSIRGLKFHPKFYPYQGKMLNAWTVPADCGDIHSVLELITRFGFSKSASADALIESILKAEENLREEQEQNKTLSGAHSGPDIYIPGLRGELRNYQRAAVDWILRNRRVYIGDEMGTGKTLCALAAIAADGAYPAVVVCPASVKYGWQRQIDNFFPGLSKHVFICNGRKAHAIPEDTRIIIVNYDVLAHWLTALQRYGYLAVVLDEAHFIKSRGAKRTRAAAVLADGADIRVAMSGTPITNRPIDLVSQLQAIGRMEDLTGGRRAWWFIERYCAPRHNGFGWNTSGASNLFELSDRLRRTGIMIRRRKEDILSELPPKERVSIPLEMSSREEYERVRRDISFWIEKQIDMDEKFQQYLSTLDEAEAILAVNAAISEKVTRAHSALAITKLNALRQACVHGKMDAAITWVEDFLTSGEKLVVFCNHRFAVKSLSDHLGDRAVRVIGGMGAEQKQQAIETFIDDDSVRVVVANIDAAAEGIDGWQTVCSNVAFIELTWTPVKHHQAEDRCHRSGQNNPVTCYYLLASDTIDEYLARLIDSKHAVVSAAVDGVFVEKDDTILADLLRRLMSREF